jgi:XTP/dITP diphosphohydrolase
MYGEILHERHGTGGFGYDPLFKPEGYSVSVGEISEEEKNRISHRSRALALLLEKLD